MSINVSFDPPAFIQRRAHVLSLLKGRNITSLLDVGTGDAGLLHYLSTCDDDLPLTKLIGIDPDIDELRSATFRSEDRWRPLEVSLYHGAIEDLGHFDVDAITQIEVLEHMDKPSVPLNLRPKMCIVSTPNRDFNAVFERIGKPVAHRRHGVEYPMRHDDHRFEFTRHEFQDWSCTEARKHGYDVSFSGVGSVVNAIGRSKGWRDLFPEEDLMTTFGHSTQFAVFQRRKTWVSWFQFSWRERPGQLVHLITHAYEFLDDGFPPTREECWKLLVSAEVYVRPMYDDQELYIEAEMKASISVTELWESSYTIRRAYRFHEELFLRQMDDMTGSMRVDVEEVDEPRACLVEVRVTSDAVEYSFDITSFQREEESDYSYDE